MKTTKYLFMICSLKFEVNKNVFQIDVDDENVDIAVVFHFDDLPWDPPKEAPKNDETRDALLEGRTNHLTGVRASNRIGQAQWMLQRSAKYQCPVKIGDYANLPITDVDIIVASAPNIICRIVDIYFKYDTYELTYQSGVLVNLICRNGFEKIDTVADINGNSDKKVTVREAATAQDIAGGEGML